MRAGGASQSAGNHAAHFCQTGTRGHDTAAPPNPRRAAAPRSSQDHMVTFPEGWFVAGSTEANEIPEISATIVASKLMIVLFVFRPLYPNKSNPANDDSVTYVCRSAPSGRLQPHPNSYARSRCDPKTARLNTLSRLLNYFVPSQRCGLLLRHGQKSLRCGSDMRPCAEIFPAFRNEGSGGGAIHANMGALDAGRPDDSWVQ